LESRRDLQLAKTSFVASPNPFREQAADWQKLDPNEAFWRPTASISDALVKELPRTVDIGCTVLYETWSSSPKSRCANLIELWQSIHSLRDFGGYHDWVERFDEAHFHIPRVKG
jgi:hypothetical protein